MGTCCRLVCNWSSLSLEFFFMWKDPLFNNWTRILGLGIVTLLQAAGLIELPGWVTWAAFAAIMRVGFGLEFKQKKSAGSCYRC